MLSCGGVSVHARPNRAQGACPRLGGHVVLDDGEDVEVPPEVDPGADGTHSIPNGVQDADGRSALSSKSFRGAGGRSGDAQLRDGFVCISLSVRHSADDLVRALAGVVEDRGARTTSSNLCERVDDSSSEDAQQVDREQVGNRDAVDAPAASAATLAATPVSEVQRSSATPPGQPAIVPQQ